MSRHKSYEDQRWRRLEFVIGEHVLLRVKHTIRVGRAIKSKKLTLVFIGSY